jgi:hypothetical protein
MMQLQDRRYKSLIAIHYLVSKTHVSILTLNNSVLCTNPRNFSEPNQSVSKQKNQARASYFMMAL